MSKTLALFLMLITVTACLPLASEPVNAQIIPMPSVPEFTLRYVDLSYDVPPETTATIDPYTGNQIVTTQAGYRVYNQSYYLVIKNQPFTPYTDSSGHFIHLAYTFRWKGHYSDSWNYLPNRTAFFGAQDALGYVGTTGYGDYTIIVLGLNWKENPIGVRAINRNFDYDYFIDVPVNGTVDFQVQAFIGYSELVPMQPALLYPNQYYNVVVGQMSGWSSTQTITRPASSGSPLPTPTPASVPTSTPTTSTPNITPFVSDTNSGLADSITLPLTTFIVVTFVLPAIILLSVLAFRRYRKTANSKQPTEQIFAQVRIVSNQATFIVPKKIRGGLICLRSDLCRNSRFA